MREMDRMPPWDTRNTAPAVTAPTSTGERAKESVSASAMALDWTQLPTVRATSSAEREKRGASARPSPPSRASITYMGPPTHWPFSSRRRYFTERRHSENLVARAGRELSSIQTNAPGPPAVRAAATPTMFPVPMVAERAVIRAEKGLTPPLFAFRDSRERARRRAFPIFRMGRNRVRRVRKTPVPSSSAMVPPPQRSPRRVKSNSMTKPPFGDNLCALAAFDAAFAGLSALKRQIFYKSVHFRKNFWCKRRTLPGGGNSILHKRAESWYTNFDFVK